jgi:molybdenum cofactor cytidylyltransferase
MKFGPVPLDQAHGSILVHNITAPSGRRALRKGKPLTADDIDLLRALGRDTVYVATLEADDVAENEAAERITRSLLAADDGRLRYSGPATGRCNIYATGRGLLRIDVAALQAVNGCEGVTLATLPTHTPVQSGKMIATLKILPYALPQTTLNAALARAGAPGLLKLDPLPRRRVALLLSGSPHARERVINSFEGALGQRLAALGSSLVQIDFIPLEDEAGEIALAAQLRAVAATVDLIILAGETAITDRHDIAPRAVERAGGTVVGFGAPVDPGNLLMLAYIGQRPVVGAPGCARSPKENIVDLILPRLLAGDQLTKSDIIALGHGGLLEDVPERPLPRSRIT